MLGFTFEPRNAGFFIELDMLDGLQTENRTLFDLVQLQEVRINRLKDRVKQLETERDILISDSLEKDEGASSARRKKQKGP